MNAPAAQRDGSGHTARARGPLVGRGPERDDLTAALQEARDGRGALFLIGGEAGIGKTRLAEAVVQDAQADGDGVLWGSAWQAGGAPAFWPWTQVVRDLLRSRADEELVDDLGSGARYVAQIAPDLVDRLATAAPDAAAAASLDSETARFTAFDATASFLRAAAERRPLVIVLDDLHAADVASIRLLEFLARGLHGARILAIATHRVGDARLEPEVAEALGDLGRVGRPLALTGLSADEVSELAAARAPQPPPRRFVQRLHGLTEGNPLFVDEVLRLLAADGTLTATDALASAHLPVPEGVRHAIRRRLDPLDAAVVRLLTAGAVIGPEFRLPTLAGALGEDRTALLAPLDAAVAAGVLEEPPGALGRYRFTHALIRETLYDGLTAHERVALHAAVAEALVEQQGDRLDAPLSELAHHFLQAAPAGDPVRAADYAVRAGERALEALAYEQAVDLFGDALRALDLAPGRHERRGAILLALGQAELRAGRLEGGRATLALAAEAGRRDDDPELLARAALASAPWGLATAMADEEGLIPLLEEALDRLPPQAGALRARLLARLAAALYWSASAARRGALADEAIAMAREVDDPATLAFVLSDAHRATWDPDSPDRALPWAQEIHTLAQRLGHTELAMAAHSWRISLLLELGELVVVDREIATFARTALRLHQQRAQVQSLVHRGARALMSGTFPEAERLMGEAAGFGELMAQDQILAMRAAGLWFVMFEMQGRLGEIEAAVQQFADTHPAMPVWRCGLLCVHLQAGHEDELRRGYEAFAAAGFDTLPRDNLWLPALAFLVEACAHVGDAAGARALHALLAPYGGRHVITPDVAYIGPVDRYLALAAVTGGDHDEAATRFAAARAQAQRMGARPTLARVAFDEAQALRERDPARAHDLAAEAASIARAVGLERLAEAAEAFVAAAPAAAAATPVAPPASAAVELVAYALRRRGDVWEVAGSAAPFHLKDAKGLHHLVTLLAAPGREFHALELVGGADAQAATAGAVDPGLTVRARGEDAAGPLLDARAKAEYRERLVDLQAEIEEADSFHDPERASRAREELAFLTRELSAAVGLGGRDRRTGAAAERARVNVTRALRSAVDRIGRHDEALGHHLRTCVRTGTFCAYDPGPNAGTWDLDAG